MYKMRKVLFFLQSTQALSEDIHTLYSSRHTFYASSYKQEENGRRKEAKSGTREIHST